MLEGANLRKSQCETFLMSTTLYDYIPSAQASHFVGDSSHFWYDVSSDKEPHKMGKVTKISKGIINKLISCENVKFCSGGTKISRVQILHDNTRNSECIYECNGWHMF